MKLIVSAVKPKQAVVFAFIMVAFAALMMSPRLYAQTVDGSIAAARTDDQAQAVAPEAVADTDPGDISDLRVEKVRVDGGAEIITIFARLGKPDQYGHYDKGEVPLLSVLRDTLGDNHPENDRLRYVWMLTYTRPSLSQKISAFVPFLYRRTANKTSVGDKPPPAIADLKPVNSGMPDKVVWWIVKKILFARFGVGLKATTLHYEQNVKDYKDSAIATALTVLSLYQAAQGEKMLSDSELKDIQARLSLTDNMLGGKMQSENLHRVYDKELSNSRDLRAQNWELLRQYSERQGLYFDPVEMPDGTARHAIVWTTESDLAANRGRKFESRFLNIENPWNDSRLQNWKGFSEVRWFDEDNRQVAPETPGAHSKKMIPLALYGLDFPKIPAILIDFRDNGNPRKRELSRRILNEITKNVLGLGQFSSVPYFMSRFLWDFVTGRRGMDVNQASRYRSYAQLKVLLSLDNSLDEDLKDDITHRLRAVGTNPLENDPDVEARLARTQYENLIAYAKRPDGLPAQLEKDRRDEMTDLDVTKKQQVLYTAARIATLGLYHHREKETPGLRARMDMRRQLEYHERVVREVAFSSARPEVDSDFDALKASLHFIAENGEPARDKTSRSLARIFLITQDEEARSMCLAGLYHVNSAAAKKELLALYEDPKITDEWRRQCAEYLKLALKEGKIIAPRDAVIISAIASK